jgi:hypothetical protein
MRVNDKLSATLLRIKTLQMNLKQILFEKLIYYIFLLEGFGTEENFFDELSINNFNIK